MATRERSGIAVGTTATAGLLLVLVGFFHIAQGIVDLTNNDFYAVTQNWVFRFSVTTWGWLHLLGGVIVLLAGVGLFTGSVLARTVAVIVATISIILSFIWLPYYPWWSLLIIAFDFVVIWALTFHGRDIVSD
jgi:hypothetical protein